MTLTVLMILSKKRVSFLFISSSTETMVKAIVKIQQFYLILLIGIIVDNFCNTLAYLRFTDQSCVDLIPRNLDDYTHVENLYMTSSKSRFYTGKQRRNNYGNEIPFKITATGHRYRRDADVVVQIEGSVFDGLILQARILPVTNGREYRSVGSSGTGSGNVGVVGYFRYLRFPFKHLTCFDLPASTVVDEGKPIKLGNVSFVWRAPDSDVGDIRFLASVLKGVQYWVIASNTLTFNPFPISSYSCGSTLACFRVCPYDQTTCIPRDAILVFTYRMDPEKNLIEFTLGGRLQMNNSYLGVAFGEDYENLRQADMMACRMDRGKATVEHLLIENLFLPPYLHTEEIEIDEYDLHTDENGNNVLWCRFRRSINPLHTQFLNVNKPLYHFHFWGTLDCYFQRFILPDHRNQIYTSTYKRNFSQSVNEIVSSSPKLKKFLLWIIGPIISALGKTGVTM